MTKSLFYLNLGPTWSERIVESSSFEFLSLLESIRTYFEPRHTAQWEERPQFPYYSVEWQKRFFARSFGDWKLKHKFSHIKCLHTNRKVMVTLINEDMSVTMNENLSSLLICVFTASGKSQDDFYVVHPTSCTISLSQQIYSVCWVVRKREDFPPTCRLFFHRKNRDESEWTRKPALAVCMRVSGKRFSLQWKIVLACDFHENCLKMALESEGVAWFRLDTNIDSKYLSSN